MLMFDNERVDATTAQGMLDHLRILLESVMRDPDQPIATLPLAAADEGRRLLAWGTGPVLDDGEPSCIHELVAAQVRRSPGAIAVVAGKTRLTYRELDEQANQLAHHLLALGMTRGDAVGSCLDRSAEAVVAALGILKAGGAYLPLTPSDPPARLRGRLEGADVAAVITTSGWQASSFGVDLPTVFLDTDRERIADHPTNAPAVRTTADDLAYVLHTSGSSGDPKGVMVPHRAICNQCRWRQHTFPLGAADVVVQHTPLSFDPSVWELFGPLIAGARMVVAEPGIERHPAALIELLDQHAVTTMQVVPSVLEVLLDQPGLARCRDLRRVFCGGEPLTAELQGRFFATLGAELHHLYGPAETAIDATYWSCRPGGSTALAPIERPVGQSDRPVGQSDRPVAQSDRPVAQSGHAEAQAEPPIAPIGRPIANVRVHVLDEALQPVPAGVRGELYIGGAGVALGYRGLPKLTAERFLPDPFGESPNDRLYRTGDLARWRADGILEFLGRADQQLKVRGIRVEPGEIESALVRHPAVREAGVVRQVEPGGGQLVAFVTVAEDVTPAELRGSAGRWLPSSLVPDRIEVVEALPRTVSGKLDRHRLEARASTLARDVDGQVTADGVEGVRAESVRAESLRGEGGQVEGLRGGGGQGRDGQGGGRSVRGANGRGANGRGADGRGVEVRGADVRAEPRDVLELRLHRIWQDLLPDRGFGITDDFFALGGHSLLMIRMVARIEQLLDREVSVPEVLRARTIEQLAHRLRSGPSAVALQPHGPQRATFWAGPVGEGALCYVDLARVLGEERPFYVLECVDPDFARPPGDVIEELASHYVEEVRRIQPEGPYSLGGWSTGGAIAAEVARQLGEHDEPVNPLILLDPRRPAPVVDGYYERASLAPQRSPNERRADGNGDTTPAGQPAGTVEHLVVLEADGAPPRAEGTRSPWERLVPAVVVHHHLRCDRAGLLREPHVGVVAEHVRAALEGAISADA
jgi:non-ribosomal peptide synthetase component F/thioesterase domain-containing protein